MSLRARIIAFLTALVTVAILQQQRVVSPSVGLFIAVAVYVVVVLPTIGKQ